MDIQALTHRCSEVSILRARPWGSNDTPIWTVRLEYESTDDTKIQVTRRNKCLETAIYAAVEEFDRLAVGVKELAQLEAPAEMTTKQAQEYSRVEEMLERDERTRPLADEIPF